MSCGWTSAAWIVCYIDPARAANEALGTVGPRPPSTADAPPPGARDIARPEEATNCVPSVKVRRELAATIRFDPGNTAASGKLRAQHQIGRLGAVVAFLSAEGTAGYLHPAIGEALAAADVIVPAIVLLVLLAAILRGSTETCDRVFRLLRWIANRPEPPLHSGTPSDPARLGRGGSLRSIAARALPLVQQHADTCPASCRHHQRRADRRGACCWADRGEVAELQLTGGSPDRPGAVRDHYGWDVRTMAADR